MNSVTEKTIRLTRTVPPEASFREEVLRGLFRQRKRLPCKFFYDETGSQLFDRICELDEYYLTRTELAILRLHLEEITERCGPDCLLIELGSGSSTKTRLLLDHLRTPIAYVPVDISREHLLRTAEALRERYTGLNVLPVCADFNQPLRLPSFSPAPRRTILFFPGSTIGNLEPAEAGNFLSRIRAMWQPGDGVLIGVDLQKSRLVLERAYNDSEGVTAAFNLNLLRRINRELGADFDLAQFRHRAIYNESQKRIEMHLVSLLNQIVWVGQAAVFFRQNEHITTEFSYKYTSSGFAQLARRAGWRTERVWTDARHWFGLFFLRAF